MSAAILSVDGLSHRYATKWAVQNVNFSIDRPGVVGLLGPNGAGKSTCMNAICGVITPTRGQIRIFGADARKAASEAKSNLGFLPQNAPLYYEMTVAEYLTFCARLRRIPVTKISDAVREAMEKCDVAHFAKRLIGALSGGYRQRVGLAQAILHKPSLLILDEPTNGLDPVQIISIRDLIRDLSKDYAVLLSTHILREVEAMCDRITLINEGELVFDGDVEGFRQSLPATSVRCYFLAPPELEVFVRLPFIEDVEVIGPTKFRLEIEGDQSRSCEELIRISVENDWRLTEIVREKPTLDEVFAHHTNKDRAAA